MTFTPNLKHSELNKIVLIGASTGGPGQIEKIIKSMPPLQDTSIIIAQHLVKNFGISFANRLGTLGNNPVSVARDGEILKPANIYLCCGQTSIFKRDNRFVFQQRESAPNKFNPEINTVFNSFVPFTKELNILSVILTGIGEDGVEACKQLSLSGARIITESSSSAIVDGMPQRAREEITGIEVYGIEDIVNTVREFCS